MKRKFLSMAAFAALAAVGTMTSCSDEVVENRSQDAQAGAMRFEVRQDGRVGTRGTATTAANYLEQIDGFHVVAFFHDGSGQYVGSTPAAGINIVNKGTALATDWDYETASQLQYWPGKTLDFQAVTPKSDASFTLANTPSSGSPRLTADVTVPTVVASQKDIMFASSTDVNNAATGNAVGLTFKHALSQVVFSGRVAQPTITAEVASIEIVNIHSTGNVGYRSAVNALSASATGDAGETYGVGLVASPSVTSTTAVNLTATDGALMMIPQTVAKWTTTAATAVPITTADADHNAYLKIKCTVTDVNSGTKLIDDDYVYIPFEVDWAIGNKYTYTLVFGNGSGGFDEDGNPLTSMVPITYEVTSADDWSAVDGGEIEF